MAEPARTGSWLLPLSRGRTGRARIVGFAHCGGGPSLFGAWSRHLPEAFEVWAAELPGRERRGGEPCETSWRVIVDALTAELTPTAVPTVLFGHSLGALLAFEVARRLDAAGAGPSALVVSACAAPQLRDERRDPIHELDDERFLAAVRGYGGLPDGVLEDADIRAAILPPLRADFALLDAYRYRPGRPLAAPIVALGGSADPVVPARDLEGWRQQTARRFSISLLPGDHFYLKGNALFFRTLARELSPFV